VRGSIAAAVEGASMDRMRKSFTNNHFWMGRPGLWRELLTAPKADTIATAHSSVFEALGYAADGRADLTEDAASRFWIELTGPELGATLRRNTSAFRAHLAEVETQARRGYAAAEAARSECETYAAEVSRLERELAEMQARKAALHDDLIALCGLARGLHQELDASREASTALCQRTASQQECIAMLQECIGTLEAELSAYRALEGMPMQLAGRMHELRTRFPRVRQFARSLGWSRAG
jgi:hypothetical protein